MKLINLLLLVLFVFVVVGKGQLMPDVPFKDVKTVFVDADSFKIVESKCDDQIGVQPCPQHIKDRVEFLAVLKRWLGKSGLKVVDDKEQANAILTGTLSITDPSNEPYTDERGQLVSPRTENEWADWKVEARMVTSNGRPMWKFKGKLEYPPIGFSASGPAKVEGKILAKAIQHDLKNAQK